MYLDFRSSQLRSLYSDPRFDGGYGPELVDDFRDCMQLLKAAPSILVFSKFREVVPDAGDHQYAMPLRGNARVVIKVIDESPVEVPLALVERLETGVRS